MNANVEALRARFEADPADAVAFEALEEAFFVAGEWPELVAHYERRLSAPELTAEADAPARARLTLRLAQVLEERCLQVDLAVERYQEAIRLDATLHPALVQLRNIYAGRQQWDLVLQVAELETQLPMRPFEEAAFLAEMGEIWLKRLGDGEQALVHFERASQVSPEHAPAWLGVAAAQEALAAPAEAAKALEHAITLLQGVERAAAQVRLAKLYEGPLADADRAGQLLRQALSDDPRNQAALEAAAIRAEAEEDWARFDELQEQRFALATGAVRRLAIAHEAGQVQLESVRSPQGARHWFKRALDLFPDDPMVHLYLADVERMSGNNGALAEHLQRAAELADDAAPVDVLLESAELASQDGDHGRAAENLRKALERDPDKPEVLDELAEALHRAGRDEELVGILEERAGQTPEGSPERVAALLMLGAAHEDHLDDPEAALEALERAARMDPGALEVVERIERLHRKAERWEALQAHLERSLAAIGETRPEAAELLCSLGEVLLHPLGELENARDRFRAALELEPESVRGRQGLERVALALGDDDALLEAFEREAGVTTDRSRLAFLVGELTRIFEERGEMDRAVTWAERLVEVTPESRPALDLCARLQEALGRRDALIATLGRLDVLLDGAEQAQVRRRLTALCRGAGDTEAALVWARGALEVEPDDVDALTALCQLLADDGATEEEAELRRRLASQLDGAARVECLMALAELLDGPLEDPGGAAAALEEATELADAPAELGPRLEDLLRRLGRHEALAQRLASRRGGLAEEDPEAPELDLQRALLLLDHLNRADEATPLFEFVLRRRPQDAAAVDGLERALRRTGDGERLVALLAERSEAAPDASTRAELDLERAHWLESSLGRPREARELLIAVADGGSPHAPEAETRLEQLLERTSDWPALLRRLEDRAARADEAQRAELRMRQGALCRDRLGDPEAASQHLEEAGRLAPERVEIWQGLARLYADADRPEDLLRVLEAELAATPERDRALALHAAAADLVLERQADAARAESHFRACLEIDPGFPAALGFLAERFEAEERHADLAELLRGQLEVGGSNEASGTSLRLRLAALEAGPLDEPEAAIATLEPAAVRDEALLITAEPLADLYQRTGRIPDLVALCRRAAEVSEAAGERASWHVRVADALRRSGDAAGAADAYRLALASRPEDREIQSVLRDLYRQLGEAEPLARLLEAELAHLGGPDEVPLRLELATLLAEPLERPAEALAQLQRILEIHPEHPLALERALGVARQAAPAEERAELLERAASSQCVPALRAKLLGERAALLSGELGQPQEAIACLENALTADPGSVSARGALRSLREQAGDWPGVLECIEGELAHGAASPGQRGTLLREATQIAEGHVPGQALGWLERLRVTRPEDVEVLQQIAELHRQAERPGALLCCLEAELGLEPPPERVVALEREAAEILERRLSAPGRAVACLERAHRARPEDDEVLAELERLYAAHGQPDRCAGTIEARIPLHQGAMRLTLRRKAADAWARHGELNACAAQLWAGLGEAGCSAADRAELLGELADVLGRLGRDDLRGRVAEQELAELDPAAPVFEERRRELHQSLARLYRERLGRRSEAASHSRALLDGGLLAPEGPTSEAHDREERALLDLLRQSQNAAELEPRLTRRLERLAAEGDDSPAGWLELGRLRRERLHRPAAAAAAFREVLRRDEACLEALRGLRSASQRMGDSGAVAETLEREIAQRQDAPAAERGALLRRLGEVAWKALDETPRASRAFAGALEADPKDLVALRCLEQLFETMEDWRGALDLYESEVEVLGEREPERRQIAWLRAGEIARERTAEPERALRAYEAAAEIASLPVERRREWAELYRRLDRPERFAEVFASWVDDAAATATAADHLELASALEALDRREDALERVRRALDLTPEYPDAWDAAARLELALGDSQRAAESLEEAALRRSSRAAAERRLLAAGLVAEADLSRAARLLEEATEDDPSLALAHARLACACGALSRPERALAAAEQALALAEALSDEERLASDLTGAEAARGLQELDAAARLFADALEVAPDHAEALASQGEVLAALGDWSAAREVLERRVGLEADAPHTALHDTLLGAALEEDEEDEAALDRYASALETDPTHDPAHERRVALLERLGRRQEAVDALQTWAARTSEAALVGERLLRAAEMELASEDREEPAEGLLREAISAAPETHRAWALLCELVWRRGDGSEARALASRALEHDLEAGDRARVGLVRAQALEAAGERREAAEAYADTSQADPAQADAALAAARLLRGLGDWRTAADLLRRFLEGPGEQELGQAWHQLGRLLAGPLEDVGSAIDAYRNALEEDPELREAREALADLLVHRPEHWDEAIHCHRELLEAQPLRLASLRGLLRIARGRERRQATASGLSILRALGAATPEERIEAPPRPAVDLGRRPRFSDPVWETLRRVTQEAQREIGEALGAGAPSGQEAGAGDPVARFREAVTVEEGRLSAPALVPLETPDLAETITLVVQMTLEAPSVQGNGDLVNALSRALGRRVRRRVRKTLDGLGPEAPTQVDFWAWRAELRGLASAVALAEEEHELRTAFLAWTHGDDPESARTTGPEADLRDAVAGSPEALALLRHVTRAWIDALA